MRSFGVQKFKGLLLAGSLTVLANYIIGATDAIISGNLIGADALAGINLVNPFHSIITFFAGLVATGVGTLYSMELGRCNKRRACEYFVQGLWTLLIFEGLVAAVMIFGGGAFLRFFGASPEATGYASAYLAWMWPLAFLEGLQALLVTLGYADGETRLCVGSYALTIVVNIVVSIICVKLGLGTAGCAIGSGIALIAGILVLAVHFLRPTNTFRPVSHFAWKDSRSLCQASFGDAAAFLCDALLFLFINKFAISTYGPSVLPVVGVAAALWGFLELFNGIGVAVQPIVTVYFGEGNSRSIREVMGSAMRVALVEGIGLAVLFFAFPRLITALVGFDDPTLIAQGVNAVRVMCAGFVALAFAGLFNSYYMFVECAALSAVVTFLAYLVMPILMVATLGQFGVNGMWAGIALGPYLALGITALVIIFGYGRGAFPLLLDRSREAKLHVFDLTLDNISIATVSAQVAELLTSVGADQHIALRASLMTEEVFMTVKDRAGKRLLLGEVTLDLNDGITLTLRDDGEIFDITDADAKISSLRTYLVASVMENHRERVNLVTTGFNRNVFKL